MVCLLCGQRRARRACPALGRQICAICCGTKRLVEIQCPSDCAYLASAREHPPAVVLRQQLRDAELVAQFIRELSDRQSQLFLLLSASILDYQPPEWQPLGDDDVAEAAAALASTFETASRGVIYEHRPASLPAERLMAALKPLIVEAGKNGGTAFERDAAVVLRRVEEAARATRKDDPGNTRAMIELLGRVLEKPEDGGVPPRDERPRLILP